MLAANSENERPITEDGYKEHKIKEEPPEPTIKLPKVEPAAELKRDERNPA